jgi:type I restriction enzyme, S subunit
MSSKWEKVKLKDICRNVTQSEKNPLEKGIERYIGLEHLDSESLKINRWGLVAEGTSFTRKFQKGQILFGKRRAYQKKAAVPDFDGVCSGDLLVLEAIEDRIIPEILPHIIQNDLFFDYAVGTSYGSLSPRTKWSHLANFDLFLPNKELQREILKKINILMQVIDKQELLLNNTRIYRKKLLNKLLIKGINNLVFKKTKIGEIPESWELKSIKDYGKCIRGVSYKPETDLEKCDTDNTVRLLRSNNIQEGKLNTDELVYVKSYKVKEEQYLRNGDIVICMANGTKKLVGKNTFFKLNDDYCYTVGSFCSFYRANNNIDTKYIYYLLNSNIYKKNLLILLSGSNINNLKNSDIEGINFPFPPKIEEREKIVEILEATDETVESIEKYLQNLKELKKVIFNNMWK